MSFWTLEPVSDLRQCVENGRSARDTAAILTSKYGLVSRNACISKAKREGVIFHSDPFEHRRGERRLPRKHSRPRIIGAKRTKGVPVPPTPPRSVSQADHAMPIEQRKGLLDLTNETCRYPIGEPQEAEFFFCGAPEADLLGHRPYCARHSRITTNKRRPLDLSDAERERRRRWASKLFGATAA